MKRLPYIFLSLAILVLATLFMILRLSNSHYETQRLNKFGAETVSQFTPPPPSGPVVYTDTVATLDQKLVNRSHYTLGTSAYTNEIQGFVATYGPRKTFTIVMSDVAKYEKDLDQNTLDTLHRFHVMVSGLVYKIGYVDPEMHYFRNKLNRTPHSLNDLMRYNATMPVNKRWKLLTVLNSVYHLQGKDGEYHLKFVSYDGFCEAVFDRHGQLLNEKSDPINMGTFNYSAGIPKASAHLDFDMKPFILYGNTPNSPERGAAAIKYYVRLTMIQYQAHSLDVYQYRKHLFGVQSGWVQ